MSMIASSSRTLLAPSGSSAARRTVVHHARPPRQPMLRPPQQPKTPLPTAGTSHPNATASPAASATQTRSAQISGTNYTLHHAPPPSAPSYTTGTMPPFLQWCKGNTVALNGEEQARARKARRQEIQGGLGWNEEMLAKMRQMRTDGMSRRAVGEALSIPAEYRHLIARAAPATAEDRRALDDQLEDQKSTWGYRKRVARDIRQKRKDFW